MLLFLVACTLTAQKDAISLGGLNMDPGDTAADYDPCDANGDSIMDDDIVIAYPVDHAQVPQGVSGPVVSVARGIGTIDYTWYTDTQPNICHAGTCSWIPTDLGFHELHVTDRKSVV